MLDGLIDKIEALEQHPQRGMVPKELEALGISEFRQLALSPYRLIYRVVGQTAFIFVIADGRRDMQTLLEQRLLRR